MSKQRILVAAWTKHGSTTQIADAIAEELRALLPEADVVRRELDEVDSLEHLDALVLGSAVYAGHWRKPARRFIEHHSARLRELYVWLFSSGPLGEPATPHADPVDVDELVAISGAIDHRTFSGRLDPAYLTRAERLVTRAVHAPSGDFRDWSEVRAWADDIARALAETGAVSQSAG